MWLQGFYINIKRFFVTEKRFLKGVCTQFKKKEKNAFTRRPDIAAEILLTVICAVKGKGVLLNMLLLIIICKNDFFSSIFFRIEYNLSCFIIVEFVNCLYMQ